MNEYKQDFCNQEKLVHNLLQWGRQAIMKLDIALEEVGLSGAKMWALQNLIESEEALGLTQLADCLGSGKSNATQITDRLAADGLVRRIPHPEDRRAILLEVTEEGRARYQAGLAIRVKTSQELLENLSQEESHQLSILLDKLLQTS